MRGAECEFSNVSGFPGVASLRQYSSNSCESTNFFVRVRDGVRDSKCELSNVSGFPGVASLRQYSSDSCESTSFYMGVGNGMRDADGFIGVVNFS